MSYNFICVEGRLGRDPKLRETSSGEVCSFSVAVEHGWGDKKVTKWYDCSIWGNRGRKFSDIARKGSRVTLHGELTFREHEGKEYAEINVAGFTWPDRIKDEASTDEPSTENKKQSKDELPF